MAKRNHTSKKVPSSNPADSSGSQPPTANKAPHRPSLHEAIEAERSRLLRAHSLLNCLYLALENPDGSDPDRQVYCPDIVDMVRDIVQESVNRLDSVSMRPLVGAD